MRRRLPAALLIVAGCFLPAGLGRGAEGGSPFPVLHGPYLGQRLPGTRPRPFGWGIISTAAMESGGTATPDGAEFFFTRRAAWDGTDDSLLCSKEENGGWTQPGPPSFARECREGEAVLSPDGSKLYFCSSRTDTLKGNTAGPFWVVNRIGSTWGQPHSLGAGINNHAPSSVSATAGGRLYFAGSVRGRQGVCRSIPVQGKYEAAEILPDTVNRLKPSHPFIAPDESYLLFDAPSGPEGSAIFLSFRQADGTWSDPSPLGPEINATHTESHPRISPDGRYLFFTRAVGQNLDIYWVSAKGLAKALDGGPGAP